MYIEPYVGEGKLSVPRGFVLLCQRGVLSTLRIPPASSGKVVDLTDS